MFKKFAGNPYFCIVALIVICSILENTFYILKYSNFRLPIVPRTSINSFLAFSFEQFTSLSHISLCKLLSKFHELVKCLVKKFINLSQFTLFMPRFEMFRILSIKLSFNNSQSASTVPSQLMDKLFEMLSSLSVCLVWTRPSRRYFKARWSPHVTLWLMSSTSTLYESPKYLPKTFIDFSLMNSFLLR